MKLYKAVNIWLLSLLLASNLCFSQELKVGLIAPDRLPYYSYDARSNHYGIYIDILEVLFSGTSYALSYEFLPQARLRHWMEHDKLDVEPGIDKTWRQKSKEIENSVYTDVFMSSDEVYVFAPGREFDVSDPRELEVKILCSVNGFNLVTEADLDSLLQTVTEDKLLSMIEKKRCDYALLPWDIVKYWNKTHELTLEVSDVVKTYHLRIRLNKKFASVVPHLNKKIAAMKKNGQLERILNKYRQ